MADSKKPKNSRGLKKKSKSTSEGVSLNVGGSVGGNVIVGDHNYVVNNYYPVIENNTEKHEPDYWALKHPYPMPPNFTGRIAERALLSYWLKEDSENRLFILRALGGFGKSALAWQWLTHDVDIKEHPKVVFWSFYEGDASFEHFIEETLRYLNLEIPQGTRPQVDELLESMQKQKILLIMDGFERALRAYSSMNAAYQGDEEPKLDDSQYDCVNLNAEIFLKSVCSLPNIQSKILMTTRLTPRAVKPRGEFMLGCREEKLDAMQKQDAVEFFHKQKIRGTHAEIEAACATYGYHPLSLRLLAGRISKDFENPTDIAVVQKLKIDGDLKAQKRHVLEVAYNNLPPQEQKLLSTIACFRSPVTLEVLKSISESKGILDKDLHDLVERGLLHFDNNNKKFDLHPIVRRYTYERLTLLDRIAAHTYLSDYFAAVETLAKPQTLDDLSPIVELFHHRVRAGELDKAWELFDSKIWRTLYYQLGAYQTQIELLSALFMDGEDKPPRLKEESHQTHMMNELANAYSVNGQPQQAVPLFERKIAIQEKNGDKLGAAIGLGNLAYMAQIYIGALRAADSNLRRSIELGVELHNEFHQAVEREELGHLLAYRGEWDESEAELTKSTMEWEKRKNPQGLCLDEAYRALSALLIVRDPTQSKISFGHDVKDRKPAIQFAQRAVELALDGDPNIGGAIVERDVIRASWLLGASYRLDGQLELAEHHLSNALTRDRAINMVDLEANILLDLARLHYDLKNYGEAKSLAEEALTITERCGYVLQGADVNLFLAQYALEQEKDKAKAKEYAETALKLAYCDGPPYYYKVAYHEAERMLEKLA